jgi:radical SAM protein with 4Fe4S-binding SPASM domain
MIHRYTDPQYNFKEVFDDKTGFYLRTDILDENGKETGVQPFMRSFPSLLDIGIMGKCSSVHTCKVGCYQQGGVNKLGKNMSLDFFKTIIDEISGYTFEVALGGFGNPNEHEDFEEILRYARSHGVVPNYTTSGTNLTEEQIIATKNWVGAVAVSFHKQDYTFDAIRRFIEHGCKTNIHFVVGNDSIDEAIYRLENDDFPGGVNACIFLLYKPIGKVKDNNTLHPRDPRVKRFYELIEVEHPFKCGLDSCHMPGVVNFTTKVLPESMSPCDAGRFSMYITPDGYALPCSFDTTNRNWAVDLNLTGVRDAWDGDVFNDFRQHQKYSCQGCKLVDNCMGGCGLMATKINLCDRDERDYVRSGA